MSNGTTQQESEISFLEFENGIEKDEFYEEITNIFFNDIPLNKFEKEYYKEPVFIERPKNPFFKNFQEPDSM